MWASKTDEQKKAENKKRSESSKKGRRERILEAKCHRIEAFKKSWYSASEEQKKNAED